MKKNALVGRPMEILLIEDDFHDARLTMTSLKERKVENRLTLIRDGKEAMEFLHQEKRFCQAPRPDLILLDLSLPKKDGREVLTEIKSDENLQSIPIVILTGSMSEEDRLRAEQLQVEGYITKPVDYEHFLALIEELTRHWREDVILPSTS